MKSSTWMFIVAAVAAVAGLAFLGGCFGEPTAMYKGQKVTEAQLPEVVARDIAAAEAAAKAKAEGAAAAAAAQAARLEREAAERTKAFERAMQRLLSEQEFARYDLADVYEAEMAKVREAVAEVNSAAQAEIKSAMTKLEEFTAEAQRTQAIAQAEIDRQWNAREAVGSVLSPVINTAGSLFPAVGGIITALGGGAGIVGLLGMNRQKKKTLGVNEALRAALAAAAMLPEPMRSAFEAALKTQADAADEAVIAKIKKDDDLHAVPEMRIAA